MRTTLVLRRQIKRNNQQMTINRSSKVIDALAALDRREGGGADQLAPWEAGAPSAIVQSPVEGYVERLRRVRLRIAAEAEAARALINEAQATLELCHQAQDDLARAAAALSRYV